MYILRGERRTIVVGAAAFYIFASFFIYFLHFSGKLLSIDESVLISYIIYLFFLIFCFFCVKIGDFKSPLDRIDDKMFWISIKFISYSLIFVCIYSIINFRDVLNPEDIFDYFEFVLFMSFSLFFSQELKIVIKRKIS